MTRISRTLLALAVLSCVACPRKKVVTVGEVTVAPIHADIYLMSDAFVGMSDPARLRACDARGPLSAYSGKCAAHRGRVQSCTSRPTEAACACVPCATAHRAEALDAAYECHASTCSSEAASKCIVDRLGKVPLSLKGHGFVAACTVVFGKCMADEAAKQGSTFPFLAYIPSARFCDVIAAELTDTTLDAMGPCVQMPTCDEQVKCAVKAISNNCCM